MKRPAAVGTVVALFLVGVVVGALGANLLLHRRVRTGGVAGIHAMEAERIQALEGELKRRLQLRPEQEQQIDAILADTHRETWALFQEVRPKIAAVVKSSQDRIGQVLDAEQRQQYQRFLEERAQSRLEHRRHAAHGAGPGDAGAPPAASPAPAPNPAPATPPPAAH